MFLTPDELITLTGCRRPSGQIRWLRAHQIRHWVNATGHPVIARAWIVDRVDHDGMPNTPNLRAIPGKA